MPAPPRRPRLSPRTGSPPSPPRVARPRLNRRPDPIPGGTVDTASRSSRESNSSDSRSPSGKPRLVRTRETESVLLDSLELNPRGSDPVGMPPFVSWPEYYSYMADNWNAGEHMSLVGMTGSGKTTLMRELLDIRDYVCVIATKPRDASLYEPLLKKGYKVVDKFDPENIDDRKIVFRAPLTDITPEAEATQRAAIRNALLGIYRTGGWCVALDEVRYLSEQLKLVRELNLLWLQGRSLGVTLVAGTQRPVSVPLNMFEQATMQINFQIPGREDRKRASDYTGKFQGQVMEASAQLPKHEFLMVDTQESEIMRSKVE
jgi:hypothetical protein